eukprot:7863749-Pyramimonas_sp.AAC.1
MAAEDGGRGRDGEVGVKGKRDGAKGNGVNLRLVTGSSWLHGALATSHAPQNATAPLVNGPAASCCHRTAQGGAPAVSQDPTATNVALHKGLEPGHLNTLSCNRVV